MTIVRLEHPEQRPIVLHEHGDCYSITVGNIPNADAPAAQIWLAAKAVVAVVAVGTVGTVETSNIKPGSVPGRSDVYVIVKAPLADVKAFLNKDLQITSNQLH
ncbi:MAG: hypothetical protein H0W74_10615 [Sphingosinicella sp.]|nr:hypothetical protein [Sphingosinicella sp.]